MKVVGLTGGIGSGKTTVLKIFESFSIPCYICDDRAKQLINTDVFLQKSIISLLGEEAFVNGVYQRKYVSEKVFVCPELLEKLNAIVHPCVALDFDIWKKAYHKNGYVIKESAILFESEAWKTCNYIICVQAPLEQRIQRVINRDGLTRKQVLQRMSRQISDEQRKNRSDFCIINENIEDTYTQVENIHIFLSKKNTKM